MTSQGFIPISFPSWPAGSFPDQEEQLSPELGQFNLLPVELRIMIWQYATPSRFIIPLIIDHRVRPAKQKGERYWTEAYCLKVMPNLKRVSALSWDGKAPGVSAATKESRKVYLEMFTERKRAKNRYIRHTPDTIFYFDSFQDILDMRWGGQ